MTDTTKQIAREMRCAAGDFEKWGRDVIEGFADRLEALQADAREKGEALTDFDLLLGQMFGQLVSSPSAFDWKIVNAYHLRLDKIRARLGLATQPAQASEKDNG